LNFFLIWLFLAESNSTSNHNTNNNDNNTSNNDNNSNNTSNNNNNEQKKPNSELAQSKSNLRTFILYLRDPNLSNLLIINAVTVFALTAYRDTITLALQNRYALSVEDTGMMLGYFHLMSTLVQGFAILPLTNRYSDDLLIKYCLLGLAISHALSGIAPTLMYWLLLNPATSLFSGVLRTCVVSGVTKKNI